MTSIVGEHRMTVARDRVTVAPALPAGEASPPPEVRAEASLIDEILVRYLQATGGTIVRGIKSRVSEGRIESAGGVSRLKITQMSPFFILQELETPGLGRRLQGFDGITAWQYDEIEGYRELKGGELVALLGSAYLLGEGRLREQFPFAKNLSAIDLHGRRALRLQLSTLTGPAGIFGFDAETGYLLRLETTTAAGARGAVAVTMDFSEFRTIDGITYPFITKTWNSAMETTTFLENLEHDVALDAAIFAPRKDG
jgi:hypothetical protein